MDENQELTPKAQRPFFLSILCVAIFTYSSLFILVFLIAIFFNSWIAGVLNDFLANGNVNHSYLIILSVVGIVLYSMSFYAALLIWKLRRKGFYIFLLSSFLIIAFPYLLHFGNVISAIVLLILNLLILIYYRKLH